MEKGNLIANIHGSNTFNWYTIGRNSLSIHNHWVSISKSWKKVESLAHFNVGNDGRILFWHDPWNNNSNSLLKVYFPQPFVISSDPEDSISSFWGASTS